MPKLRPLIPARRKKKFKSSVYKVENYTIKKHGRIEKFLYCQMGFSEDDLIILTEDEDFPDKLYTEKGRGYITLKQFEAVCSAMKEEHYPKFFSAFFKENKSPFSTYLIEKTTEVKKVSDLICRDDDNYLHLLDMIVNAPSHQKQTEAIYEAERIIKGYKFT